MSVEKCFYSQYIVIVSQDQTRCPIMGDLGDGAHVQTKGQGGNLQCVRVTALCMTHGHYSFLTLLQYSLWILCSPYSETFIVRNPG